MRYEVHEDSDGYVVVDTDIDAVCAGPFQDEQRAVDEAVTYEVEAPGWRSAREDVRALVDAARPILAQWPSTELPPELQRLQAALAPFTAI